MRLRPLIGLLAALPLAAAAFGQAQTDLTNPTAWWYHTSASPQDVSQRASLGYRIVDLEVIATNPIRFAASYVENTGAYAKGWYWYYDQTSAGVSSLLAQNNARAIDIEPYETANGLRYAVVMIANTGADFSPSQGWQTGFTGNDVVNWVNNNPTRRIIDIQPYQVGGAQRYAFIWVSNTGALQSPWWIIVNGTSADLGNVIDSNQARLIDLEREPNSRFTALFTPSAGRTWYWFTGVSSTEVARLVDQYAGRIIDIERYMSGLLVRYNVILLQNDNDLAVATNGAMRALLPISSSSGFLVRQLGATTNTLAGVNEERPFEPASLMKTAHHFVAMRRVFQGQDSLNASVIEFTGLNGSCPTGSNAVVRTLSNVLRDMMESSSNTSTEAIRARIGTATIENVCAVFGAPGIMLNHTLGCLCGQPRNEARLEDFAGLHNAVVNGNLGSQRDAFYDLMSNGTNFGMGVYSTTTALNQELSSSSLSTAERQAFSAGLAFAHKGGSYTCNAGPEHHRSRGAYVRIPFRSGCDTIYRSYFIGAWVNDAVTASSADNATGLGLETLYRHVLRAAIDSWESASCNPTSAYCTGTPNSTGAIGTCSATGTTFVLQNNLVLRASNLPQNVFGFLLVSRSTGFVPGAGGSAGNLCLGGSIGRYLTSIASTGSAGTLSHPVSVNSVPTPGNATVEAGESLYFQWWHRDQTSSGAQTSNYTRGLRATFI